MGVPLAGRIEDVCELNYVFYFVAKVHLVLLVLSAFPVLVGELKPDGAIVLLVSTVINLTLLSISVGLLTFCRHRSSGV